MSIVDFVIGSSITTVGTRINATEHVAFSALWVFESGEECEMGREVILLLLLFPPYTTEQVSYFPREPCSGSRNGLGGRTMVGTVRQ